MAITTELVGALGGRTGYVWKPVPDVTYDLGANYPQRITVAFNFAYSHTIYVNDVKLDTATRGYWELPHELDIPNPRYIKITGGSAETGIGKFIAAFPIGDGVSAPPAG
jgi:hypothetical protein